MWWSFLPPQYCLEGTTPTEEPSNKSRHTRIPTPLLHQQQPNERFVSSQHWSFHPMILFGHWISNQFVLLKFQHRGREDLRRIKTISTTHIARRMDESKTTHPHPEQYWETPGNFVCEYLQEFINYWTILKESNRIVHFVLQDFQRRTLTLLTISQGGVWETALSSHAGDTEDSGNLNPGIRLYYLSDGWR